MRKPKPEEKEEYIEPKRIWDFRDEVKKLAKKEFGTDDEGDPVVEITIVDRKRYQRLHYMPVPYRHKIKSLADQDHHVRAISCNLSIAQEEVKNYFSHESHDLSNVILQEERAQAARKSKIRLCWVPGCMSCSGYTYKDEAEMDRMGFVHYGTGGGKKPPTEEPKNVNYCSGIYRFMLRGDYFITWCPEPIIFDKKPPRTPWGQVDLMKPGAAKEEVTQFRYDKSKPEGERLQWEHKDHVPPYLIPLIEAEISRPLIPLPKEK